MGRAGGASSSELELATLTARGFLTTRTSGGASSDSEEERMTTRVRLLFLAGRGRCLGAAGSGEGVRGRFRWGGGVKGFSTSSFVTFCVTVLFLEPAGRPGLRLSSAIGSTSRVSGISVVSGISDNIGSSE